MVVALVRWDLSNPNVRYLFRVDVDHTFFLLSEEGVKVLTTPLNEEFCRERFSEVEVFRSLKELRDILKKEGVVRMDMAYMPASLYRRLHLRLKDVSEEFLRLREVKSKKEIAILKRAKRVSLRLILDAFKDEDKREIDVAKGLKQRSLKSGEGWAFEPVVANLRNARFPHYTPSRAKVGDEFLIDFGVRVKGYNADLTRCRTDRKEYRTLREVTLEIADEMWAGRSIKDFVGKVEELLRRRLGRLPPHSIGHGIGLEVHEYPILSKRVKGALKEGSIICIEPAIYGKIGMRYEDMFVVGRKGARPL